MEIKKKKGKEEIITTACCSHCAGTCLLKCHVQDGVLVSIETDDGESPRFRACPKGRAMRQVLYHPDRLMYPLRRVGKRGEGKFERISWDEALDTVANELKRVKETYGPASIVYLRSGGDTSVFQGGPLVYRLLGLFGGYTRTWGFHSFEGGIWSSIVSYGTPYTYSSREDLVNSRLIILWGWNPVSTIQNSGSVWALIKAREAGAQIVSIDPKLTNTTTTVADQWLTIKPSTDAAMLIAMAYVIINENLQDQAFLDRYTVGFAQYKRYVIGEEDGIPKTPAWAEKITGVPASAIEALARKFATMKPAALIDGISPGRTAYGEQYHRAAMALAAMTGNIGIRGGNAPGRSWGGRIGTFVYKLGGGVPAVPNPLEKEAQPRPNTVPAYENFFPGDNRNTRFTREQLIDGILEGKAGGYPADYKFLYITQANVLNQLLNVNKIIQAFRKLEFIVTHEQFLTPTAKYSDIVLPVTTRLERDDICVGHGLYPAYGYLRKVVEPLGECKSHFEICVELARRLGITNYSDKTEEEYLKQIVGGSIIPDYESFKKEGIYTYALEEPYIAFKAQIDDPEHNPFPTPSGKIEIYSRQLADMNNPEIPPVPRYLEPWEGPSDPLKKKYPLQLITTHIIRRSHSVYETVPWLRELQTQAVTINNRDAAARGIKDGDIVRIFNERGEVRIPARVTGTIMPGVVDIPEGAWYDPDENGIDRGGNPNVLTRDKTSPAGVFPSNTTLVEVARV